MIRPATFGSLALCAALGFGLFKVKYQVQGLEGQLLAVQQQIADDQEQMHVLKAEWSYLTQPARLGDLAARHLTLQPLTAAQIGGFDTLPLREQPPAPAAPAQSEVSVAEVLKAMQVAARPQVAPAPAPVRAGSVE